MTNNNIEERLDLLRERIQDESFLEGKVLSNREETQMLCCDAKHEMIGTYFIEQIKNDPSIR